jgi:hypothetical protein
VPGLRAAWETDALRLTDPLDCLAEVFRAREPGPLIEESTIAAAPAATAISDPIAANRGRLARN